MKQEVVHKGFANDSEEIYFFKSVKPVVLSKLLLYVKWFTIQSKIPRSTRKAQKRFLIEHIDKLQGYVTDHLEFYHYYRQGATAFDAHFFLRRKTDMRWYPEGYQNFTDEVFTTSHDVMVATILANDMLITKIKKEIAMLSSPVHIAGEQHLKHPVPKLFWTGGKVDLIELIYALQASGAINSGTAEIKEITKLFETVFHIALGDVYRTYLELRSRKINPTKFIQHLQTNLQQRMHDADAL
ncbi:RteC domain-containing protein [Zhouia sp. PK063]|uniref:RteC domain-containing protein n=1 Tax=Zhouia sp. PK063 TaxID=3373602 RepID=UPI003788B774